MQLSGGTTGVPKVIPRLHRDYLYNAQAWAASLAFGPDRVVLLPMPLIHNAGISAALHPTHLSGGRFVLGSGVTGLAVLQDIERYGVTDLPVVPPTILLRMVDEPRRKEIDHSTLQRVIVGGQSLPAELADRAEQALGIPVLQMFGMAEGMFFRNADDAPLALRRRTVGAPISSFDEVRVLAPGSEEPVPPGQVGELCCRGPYTIRGYYDARVYNARAFTTDGFYRTGDLARRWDIDGTVSYSIEGRIKDMINRGVEKISAEEVEDVLSGHPSVERVAVVAMPDREMGEKGCAFVVARPGAAGLTLAAVQKFLAEAGLAKFKWPERLEIVDDFPLTNVGKVSKRDLRARVEQLVAETEGKASTTRTTG
jgi:2,3-dihydroxybenzoate-AMP ligase